MSIEILEGKDGRKAMFCNTTMWAFGAIFYANEDVQSFIEWLPEDARTYEDSDLESKIHEWRNQ